MFVCLSKAVKKICIILITNEIIKPSFTLEIIVITNLKIINNCNCNIFNKIFFSYYIWEQLVEKWNYYICFKISFFIHYIRYLNCGLWKRIKKSILIKKKLIKMNITDINCNSPDFIKIAKVCRRCRCL